MIPQPVDSNYNAFWTYVCNRENCTFIVLSNSHVKHGYFVYGPVSVRGSVNVIYRNWLFQLPRLKLRCPPWRRLLLIFSHQTRLLERENVRSQNRSRILHQREHRICCYMVSGVELASLAARPVSKTLFSRLQFLQFLLHGFDRVHQICDRFLVICCCCRGRSITRGSCRDCGGCTWLSRQWVGVCAVTGHVWRIRHLVASEALGSGADLTRNSRCIDIHWHRACVTGTRCWSECWA
ncbi:hypothetical protein BDW22DRAFT_814765 [Trametopsis cervina]|nr:hypothetical protein BDW22DRAFT_814765 [Trametopsis cervina]